MPSLFVIFIFILFLTLGPVDTFKFFLFLITWATGLIGFVALLYSRGEPDVEYFPFITLGIAFLLEYIRPKFNTEKTEVESNE